MERLIFEEWIENYKKDGESLPVTTAGKKYSGKFNLRVGENLNTYGIKKLQESRALHP